MTPDQIFDIILTELQQVVPFDGASVLMVHNRRLVLVGGAGWSNPASLIGLSVDLARHETYRTFLKRAAPVIVADVRERPQVQFEPLSVLGQRAWLGVPVKLQGQVIGWLGLAKREPGYFTADHVRQVQPFLAQLAIAVESGRHYRIEHERRVEAEQRRQIAESLGGILAVLNSNKNLDDILSFITARTNQLLGTDANAIYHQEEHNGPFVLVAAQGYQANGMSEQKLRLVQDMLANTVGSHQPVTINNMAERGLASVRYQALLAVPLLIKGEVYGGIILFYRHPRLFSREEIELAMVFSDQVALAIENSRLRLEVKQAAVIAERNRLAQDLHDAVSQTLFSVSAIAEALPRVWARHPEAGEEGLKQLHLLSRTALAEMRTLLLELRPTTLAETRLAELLRQLGDGMAGRIQAPVGLNVTGERALPLEVKVVLYRIAQEALNNIAKHAHADQVTVNLAYQPDQVMLQISDNGCGFNPNATLPHQLGVNIMAERATGVGASFRVDSRPGQGTCVTAIWPDPSRNPAEVTVSQDQELYFAKADR
ncbi:MAG: GAF domain-containing protein [Anaerolineae bacterium]|nr:GAF domain-containing protein [Anaerolineae bacterium]